MTPQRFQLSRKKGWRMPPNAVKVDRSTRWGNPHVARGSNTAAAVAAFKADLLAGRLKITCEDVRRDLAGKDLGCWCWRDWTCHADVLLEIANPAALLEEAADALEGVGRRWDSGSAAIDR